MKALRGVDFTMNTNILLLELQRGITLVILILQPQFPIKCTLSDG